MSFTSIARHLFTASDFDAQTMPFQPSDYSRLKFGCLATAERFGVELADWMVATHPEAFASPCLVIPSPYNNVENAATLVTKAFLRRANRHLAEAGLSHVDYALINRKLSYTKDYGFMDSKSRADLLKGDTFYFDSDYFRGKTLILLDDIRITGAHEHRVRDILSGHDAPIFSVYYAMMTGDTSRSSIEAELNLNGIDTIDDIVALSYQNVAPIIRPIKYVLTRQKDDFLRFLANADGDYLSAIYDGAISEGYYAMDDFSTNLKLLGQEIKNRENNYGQRFALSV